MTAEQVQTIVHTAGFPGAQAPVELVETHISWVILTPDFAFKIKKPLHLDFLDFSSIDKRQFFCLEELRLNRRLAPEIYLDVLPIGLERGLPKIGATAMPVIDYALQMHRVDNQLQMDLLMEKNQVSEAQIEQLAAVLAPFHLNATLPPDPEFRPGVFWTDFAELYQLQTDIEQQAGPGSNQMLENWQAFLPLFLERQNARLIARQEQGFWVDGHGDLHTRNIFLRPDGPVVFDCIEFSAHFRQSDILNELAFLCMDLEARKQPALSAAFLQAYCQKWDIFPKAEDHLLFLFFKAYRANIRLKVTLLELRQHRSAALEENVKRYWNLMKDYIKALQAAEK